VSTPIARAIGTTTSLKKKYHVPGMAAALKPPWRCMYTTSFSSVGYSKYLKRKCGHNRGQSGRQEKADRTSATAIA
jgi:predicted secreted protein|tara:strand:- start:2663 stop:2890 length:228 start_codon:yes stop_codon:yes gene_type:complete